MTTPSLPVLRRIQLLLNTLIGEHHVRRSLLREVCDLMSHEGSVDESAHGAAVELLAELEEGTEVRDFDGRVERISSVVSAMSDDTTAPARPTPVR
jgi:hypothetical protein